MSKQNKYVYLFEEKINIDKVGRHNEGTYHRIFTDIDKAEKIYYSRLQEMRVEINVLNKRPRSNASIWSFDSLDKTFYHFALYCDIGQGQYRRILGEWKLIKIKLE